MPLFRYRAVDAKGAASEGTMEESSPHRVTAILQERGLQVSDVQRVGKRPGFLPRKKALTWEDLDLFNGHLLAITRSGLPLAPALQGMAQDVRSRRLKPILEEIQRDLERGSSLEDALNRHPDSFPHVYASAIRAGERSGNLTGVLAMLSTYSSRVLDMRAGIQTAMAYPTFVLIVVLFLVIFLLTEVLPVFTEIFQDFGSGLPAPTQFWMDVSEFLGQNLEVFLILAGVLVGGAFFCVKFMRRYDFGVYYLHWAREHLPLVGRTYKVNALARFARTLGLLLSSNVPILESLDLAAAAADSAVLRSRARSAAVHVAGGERVADALESTGYFSRMFCWLCSTGEERGEAHTALLGIADSFDREVARRNRLMMMLLGPAMVLILACIVGSIVVALYLPIFTLGDAISQ